jgi:hypothetical protein
MNYLPNRALRIAFLTHQHNVIKSYCYEMHLNNNNNNNCGVQVAQNNLSLLFFVPAFVRNRSIESDNNVDE